jgi:hypothetical protein
VRVLRSFTLARVAQDQHTLSVEAPTSWTMDFGFSSSLPRQERGKPLFKDNGTFAGRPPTRAEQEAADAAGRATAAALERKIGQLADELHTAFQDGPYASLLSSKGKRGGRPPATKSASLLPMVELPQAVEASAPAPSVSSSTPHSMPRPPSNGFTDAGESTRRLVAQHVFAGRAGVAADTSTTVSAGAARAVARAAPSKFVPHESHSLRTAGRSSATPSQLPRASRTVQSTSALPTRTTPRLHGTDSARELAESKHSPGSESRPRLRRSRLKPSATAHPKTVDDLENSRRLPRGAALARAAALASERIAVSGVRRPVGSTFDADRIREQNVRVIGARLKAFQKDLMQTRRDASSVKPKHSGLLDPEVDLLLSNLPPIAPPGHSPRVEKLHSVPPRLLGDKLTPLEKEQRSCRLAKGLPGTGPPGAAPPKTFPCALCQHRFAKVNLPTPVTRKAVFALLDEWGADAVEAFGAAAARMRVPPACYETVHVCKFCTQFFSAATEEADRSELVPEGGML